MTSVINCVSNYTGSMLWGMMLVAGDRKIMGASAASCLLMIGSWAATALMAAAVAVMLIANFIG